LPLSCAYCLEIWEPQPPGKPQSLSRPVMVLIYLSDRVTGQLIIIMKQDVELYVTIYCLRHVFKETVENNSCDLLT